ncbi:protein kinase superfamily protein [Actinidia rufa]|uniref:Protein kinase superfamily protein n=1 Tax=Actinidia rufa TaxID=165716 RepID=A0A7J0G278_9ERIC|nr:protein kinase superfamily protein [Actinidia rufa]
MKGESWGLIIGISIGVVIGVFLAIFALFCIRYHRRRSQIGSSSSRRAANISIRANGADSCVVLSDSSVGTESSKTSVQNGVSLWLGLGGLKKGNVVSASGILEYSYRDLQKATCNFTTLIGQGAYGPVYRAQMSTGETVAVKLLATDSKQGEKSSKQRLVVIDYYFGPVMVKTYYHMQQVMLLGRLHHRNLVNLVGYCAEKGQHMLIYVYMSKGSLASHLYGEKNEHLSWGLRVQLALDVARGLEYLHDGAVPPVIHRDIKSPNILLDHSMRARAAMNTEGKVGWEEIVDSRLDGKFDEQELNDVASLAYKCVNRAPRKRPSMRDIVQVLLCILKLRHDRRHHGHSSATPCEATMDVDESDNRSPLPDHRRVESADSIADACEV